MTYDRPLRANKSHIRRPLWVGIGALVLAIASVFLGSFTKLLAPTTALQVTLGLMSAGLITYMVSELERERTYELSMNRVLEDLQEIRSSISPLRVVNPEERYCLGTEIARQARARVVLFAPSLILLTGPRPYFASDSIPYEKDQHAVFADILHRASTGKSPRFECAYSHEKVAAEIARETAARGSQEFGDRVRGSFARLVAASKDKKSQFEIRRFNTQKDGSHYVFIVGDDSFAIWLRNAATQGHDICVSGRDAKVADSLVYLFGELTVPVKDEDASLLAIAAPASSALAG